ncbi:hypothetical protein [Parasphingopyxis marina]|uniref:Uncharacterized protein n=1 Tax=Parasphingopyxis marina TaxID=2761622 RepID=A0A842I2T8_9SPHN|nr:hypothetical protein [Parasphingopyxis marina]MBC2779079.1 hypothetical protein [Parasphingopyxis marina]
MTKTKAARLRLALAAFALPFAGLTVATSPALAQSEAGHSAQQIGESLVAALNGGSGDRTRWAQQHVENSSFRMQLQQLNRIARRHGDLSLVGVQEASNGIIVQVSNGTSRTEAISLVMNDRDPPKIVGIGMRGL